MNRDFTVTGYRAMRDQEDAIYRTSTNKLKKNMKMNRVLLKGAKSSLFVMLAILLLKASSIVVGFELPVFIETMISMAYLTGLYYVFGVAAVGVVSLFWVKKKLNETAAKKEELWGGKPPALLYRYDEYLDEFELFLKWHDSDEDVYLGRINSDDEIAENFNKKTQDSDA